MIAVWTIKNAGQGLIFLDIPRSYYGRLAAEQLAPDRLAKYVPDEDTAAARSLIAMGLGGEAVLGALQSAGGLVDLAGIVTLELPVRHPELKASTPARATHLGWHVEFEFRVAQADGPLNTKIAAALTPLVPGGEAPEPLVEAVSAALKRGRCEWPRCATAALVIGGSRSSCASCCCCFLAVLSFALCPAMVRRSTCSPAAADSNLYGLLRGKLTEDEYVRIVRNQILVDIQVRPETPIQDTGCCCRPLTAAPCSRLEPGRRRALPDLHRTGHAGRRHH